MKVKYDDYRVRLERDGNRVRLITRSGYNWARPLPVDRRGHAEEPASAVRHTVRHPRRFSFVVRCLASLICRSAVDRASESASVSP